MRLRRHACWVSSLCHLSLTAWEGAKGQGKQEAPLSVAGLLLYVFSPLLLKAGGWLSWVRAELMRTSTELSFEISL